MISHPNAREEFFVFICRLVWCPPESSNQQKILREYQFCITLGNICIWHHSTAQHIIGWTQKCFENISRDIWSVRMAHWNWKIFSEKKSTSVCVCVWKNSRTIFLSCSQQAVKDTVEDDCHTIIMSNMKEDRKRANAQLQFL